MSVSTTFYNAYKAKILNGNAPDLDTSVIRVALCTSSYTPSIDNHDNFDDVTNEVVGTGYTAEGEQLSITVTQDNTNNRAVVTATDTTWASSTITARYAVVYLDTGTPSTSTLICYVDFGENKTSEGDNFTIDWDATDGVFNLA